jgi:hypothetical protein
MSETIWIEGKQLGSKRALFPGYEAPYPPRFAASGGRTTLRDFIGHVVGQEVAAFRQRQEERRLFQVLTEREIDAAAKRGKINPAGRELDQEVNEAAAVAIALQAFEDGIYFVFIDGEQRTALDETVFVGPGSHVQFVRLVALAGG